MNAQQSTDARRVIALRGIPASGKSTHAKALIAAQPHGTALRINNDDLGAMLFGEGHLSRHGENPALPQLFHEARLALLNVALHTPGLTTIVIDNTNLSVRTVRALEKTSLAAGAEFIVDDQFLSVPLDLCLARDAARTSPVGETVVRSMHVQAVKLRPWVYSVPEVDPLANAIPYVNDPALPSVVLVDVDGTLAHMNDRSPFDWARVGEDTPNPAVVNLVKDLVAAGEHVVIMSGRDGSCRRETQEWLDKHVAPGLPLHMRAAGDQRKDSIIKYELFQEHIAGRYSVRFVLDDRDQVVHLWRRVLELPTFQVADGNF